MNRIRNEIRNTIDERRFHGSAILLAVVLVSLLAIVAVIFLTSARVDNLSTSAIADNENLNLAVNTVVSQISEQIAQNSPHTDANGNPAGVYYTYPDAANPWLASLEPNDSNVWPHITYLYPYLIGFLDCNLPINNVDYEHKNPSGFNIAVDADGDGIPDSRWVPIQNFTSSSGKTVYAAVRIIDNSAMLNANTAFKFDPAYSVGASQTDINLMALSWRPNNPLFPYNPAADNNLLKARNPSGLANYENDIIWRYDLPNGTYTPFDISDELEMRYRFLIDQRDSNSRLEFWSGQFDSNSETQPFDTSSGSNVTYWSQFARNDNPSNANYAYRHITTTLNLDRVIDPCGLKMVNINNADVNSIRNAIKEGFKDATYPDPCGAIASQITANLLNYREPNINSNVAEVNDDAGIHYYGFNTPCIYISEVAQNFFRPDVNSALFDPNEPNFTFRSFAIELFKPYWQDDEPNGWRILTTDFDGIQQVTPIIWTGSRRFHVLASIDTTAAEANIPVDINDNEVAGPNEVNLFDPNRFNGQIQIGNIVFVADSLIYLQRNVNGTWLTVDGVLVPLADLNNGWLEPNRIGFETHSFERDITPGRCIRNLWSPIMSNSPTIGHLNAFTGDMLGTPFWTEIIQAHPAKSPFTNVGQFGQLFYRNVYGYNYGGIDICSPPPGMPESYMRIDLTLPAYQQVFKYLTVMDPYDHNSINNFIAPTETRVKGRININTAPWFVLAQLPWIPSYDLARSIVNYRDTIHGAFKNIGELMQVTNLFNDTNSIGYWADKATTIPDALLTSLDEKGDVFEQRDAIFTRISNLVTVRSDVFTAYILVRIGTDGPQKRYVAILDRSEYPNKPVKVIAIQQVPDPR